MSDDPEELESNGSIKTKSHAAELLDTYAQYKKVEIKDHSFPTHRRKIRRTQKLIRLIEPNITYQTKTEKNKETKKDTISQSHQEPKRRARIINLKWDPDEENQKEVEESPTETSEQLILQASSRDRRRLWT